MEYKYIPTGIKRELVKFGVNLNQKEQVVGTFHGGLASIHSSGQTICNFSHMEGITLAAGEEINKVAKRASGMGMDGIGEVGDTTSEG